MKQVTTHIAFSCELIAKVKNISEIYKEITKIFISLHTKPKNNQYKT